MAALPPDKPPPDQPQSEPPPREWGFDSWEELAEWVANGGTLPPPAPSPTGDWIQVGDGAWSSVDPTTIKPGETAVVYDPSLLPRIRERLLRRRRQGQDKDSEP